MKIRTVHNPSTSWSRTSETITEVELTKGEIYMICKLFNVNPITFEAIMMVLEKERENK